MKQTLRLLPFLLLTAVPSAVLAQSNDAATPSLPDGYELSAAYPNPFNPTTTFSLKVEERQKVTVEIYNMLGQRVRQLFDGVLEGGEVRAFTFDAANLPSGIYLYRVSGETFTASRQITLLK